MKYAAMMFDVIESRKYYVRQDVQKILMNSVDYLNGLYRSSIKKEVVSSAGDEFQGLFFDLQSAFLYIRKLQILILKSQIFLNLFFLQELILCPFYQTFYILFMRYRDEDCHRNCKYQQQW